MTPEGRSHQPVLLGQARSSAGHPRSLDARAGAAVRGHGMGPEAWGTASHGDRLLLRGAARPKGEDLRAQGGQSKRLPAESGCSVGSRVRLPLCGTDGARVFACEASACPAWLSPRVTHLKAGRAWQGRGVQVASLARWLARCPVTQLCLPEPRLHGSSWAGPFPPAPALGGTGSCGGGGACRTEGHPAHPHDGSFSAGGRTGGLWDSRVARPFHSPFQTGWCRLVSWPGPLSFLLPPPPPPGPGASSL